MEVVAPTTILVSRVMPFASLAVTVYLPAQRPLSLDVRCPFDQLKVKPVVSVMPAKSISPWQVLKQVVSARALKRNGVNTSSKVNPSAVQPCTSSICKKIESGVCTRIPKVEQLRQVLVFKGFLGCQR